MQEVPLPAEKMWPEEVPLESSVRLTIHLVDSKEELLSSRSREEIEGWARTHAREGFRRVFNVAIPDEGFEVTITHGSIWIDLVAFSGTIWIVVCGYPKFCEGAGLLHKHIRQAWEYASTKLAEQVRTKWPIRAVDPLYIRPSAAESIDYLFHQYASRQISDEELRSELNRILPAVCSGYSPEMVTLIISQLAGVNVRVRI